MKLEYLKGVLERDLRAVKRELEAYPSESTIWRVPEGISNSAGNLALHLAGNIQFFVGATLGGSGYKRDREAEFSRRDLPVAELLAEMDRTIDAVGMTFLFLPEEMLTDPYPLELAGVKVTAGDFLIHLVVHLGFHLGQIDYHRRLVTGVNEPIGALAIPELASATSGV